MSLHKVWEAWGQGYSWKPDFTVVTRDGTVLTMKRMLRLECPWCGAKQNLRVHTDVPYETFVVKCRCDRERTITARSVGKNLREVKWR